MKRSYGAAMAAALLGTPMLSARWAEVDEDAVAQTSTIEPPAPYVHKPTKTQSARQRARYARQIEAGQCNLDPVRRA